MRNYGVDRGELGPVLRRLNHEGLAAPSLGRGWVFIEFSIDVILQSYQLRQLIEPSYILGKYFSPDPVRLEALRRDHENILERLSPETTFEETFALDARFHQTLAEFTGNRFFIETMRTQTNIRRLSEYLGRARLENVRISFTDHLNMINALLHNERDWAAALMRRHLSQSNDRAARYYPTDMEEIRRKDPVESGSEARKRK
jgi:DNA-binding GntR family transcriptional regulator